MSPLHDIDIDLTVRTLISDYTHVPVEDITGDRVLDELGVDSLGTVEIILACEDLLGIDALTSQEMEVRTVDEAAAFVRDRLAQKAT